jgi:hypothetical protein
VASYIANSQPVIAEQTVGSSPQIEALTDGLSAQVQAILSSDGRRATFDFRLIHARALAAREVKVQAATANQKAEATVELPTVVSDSQAGTVSVPLGSPMIVAGGTVPKSLLSGNGEDKGMIEVYYIATVRLVELPPAEKKAAAK